MEIEKIKEFIDEKRELFECEVCREEEEEIVIEENKIPNKNEKFLWSDGYWRGKKVAYDEIEKLLEELG